MSPIAMQRRLAYYVQWLGPIGIAGLVMMLLAAVGWFTVVRSDNREIEASRQKVDALQHQVTAKISLPVSSPLNQEDQLSVFYNGFSKAESAPGTLQNIYRAAKKQSLALDTGEYTRLQTGSERLVRLRVSLPVKGTFKQVLGFMDKVLVENNTVALENASFKRDKVDDDLVDAKLVFLIFMDTRP